MRLFAHISAFAILIGAGYLLASHGYPHFLRQTHSSTAAQVMTFISFAFVFLSVVWATRRMP